MTSLHAGGRVTSPTREELRSLAQEMHDWIYPPESAPDVGSVERIEALLLAYPLPEAAPPVAPLPVAEGRRSGDPCTGISAVWCPNCGDCTCKRNQAESDDEFEDAECPLHGRASSHAEDPAAEEGPTVAPAAEGERAVAAADLESAVLPLLSPQGALVVHVRQAADARAAIRRAAALLRDDEAERAAICRDFASIETSLEERAYGAERLCATMRAALLLAPAPPLQARVDLWLLECFGEEIARDAAERNHRFPEEALELVQALGCPEDDALRLVAYVYGRAKGDPRQECGGVLITLAALCLAHGIDMHAAGEEELSRIWGAIDTIRAKQAAKPKGSPLPQIAAIRALPEAKALQPYGYGIVDADGGIYLSENCVATDPNTLQEEVLEGCEEEEGLRVVRLFWAPEPPPLREPGS